MMQIYMVRHGQSQNNAGTASSHNVPLTQLGREQAHLAANALANQRFDALYCSPLERALQTACILNTKLGVAPYVHPAFSETGFSWGEKDATREQLQAAYPECILDNSVTSNGWAPANGESEDEAYERACDIVQWLCARHSGPESRVLVVTHGNFGGILMGSIVGVRPSGYTRFSQHNACISRADIVEGESKLRFLNTTAHLSEDMLT